MASLKYLTLILSIFVVQLSCQSSNTIIDNKIAIEEFLKKFNLLPGGNIALSKPSAGNLNGNIQEIQNVDLFCTRYCRPANGDEVIHNITESEIEEFNIQHLSGVDSILQRVNGSCVKYCEGSVLKAFGQSPSANKSKVYEDLTDKHSKLTDKNKSLYDDSKHDDKNKSLENEESYLSYEEACYAESYKSKRLEKELEGTLTTDESGKGRVATVQLELKEPSVILNLNIRLPNKNLGTPGIYFTQNDLDVQENIKVNMDPTLIPNLDARKLFKLLKIESPSFVDIIHLALKSLSYNSVNPRMVEALNITYEKLKILFKRDMELNTLPMVFIKTFHPVIEKNLIPQLDIGFVRKIIKLVDESFKFPRVFAYLKEVTEVPNYYLKKDFTLSNLVKVIDKLMKKLIVRNNTQNRVLKKFYKRCLRRLIKIIKKDIEHNDVPINFIKFTVDTLISGSRSSQSKNLQKSLYSNKPRRDETYGSFREFLDHKSSKELRKSREDWIEEYYHDSLDDCRGLNAYKENGFCKRIIDLVDHFSYTQI